MPLRIQSPTVLTQPLPTGPSHQYTTYAYLQACLMENTGQTDINSQTISRCTQITAPRPDTAAFDWGAVERARAAATRSTPSW